jgi:hypothetical protein
MESSANPMQSAHDAQRCHAKAKTSGNRCNAPAVTGWKVCRMHGAGSGAPTGSKNGAWKHGDRSGAAEVNRRNLMAFVRLIQDELEVMEASVAQRTAASRPQYRKL